MRKVQPLFLLTLLVMGLGGFLLNTGFKAQDKSNKTSALETYAKWREKALGSSKRISTPHIALAVVSQKLNEESARIEYVLAGSIKGMTIEIIPERVTILPGNQVLRENTGGGTTIKQGSPTNKKIEHRMYESSAEFVIGPETNALVIKWTPDQDGNQAPNTFEIPLNYERYAGSTGSVSSGTTNDKISKVNFGTGFLPGKGSFEACEKVTMTCTGGPCGSQEYCKMCGNTIDNSTSCVTCTISCGTSCSGGDNCPAN